MNRYDRRGLLRGALGVAALAGAGAALSACATPGTEGAARAGAGRLRGGRLRLAAAGAAAQTLNVGTASGMTDYIAMFALYDSLALLRGDRIVSQLAESIEPNADATAYTVRIHPGVRFHDGRRCTAADVRYSLATLADPRRSPYYSQFYADMDAANLKVVDERTLRIPLRRPRADFIEGGLGTFSPVFPEGTKGARWEQGIGSGPFRLAEPGDSAATGRRVLARNDDYWGKAALLDEVEVSTIADAEARLNALRGGQIDYAYAISPAGAAAAEGDSSVAIVRGGPANSQALTLEMNIGHAPFDDPDVRLALKLLVDRKALVDTVLFGQGRVGNDLIGQGLVGFNQTIQRRERDVGRARSLLRSAGVSKLTLRSAELVPGMTDAAKLFVEQAAEAGLTVTIEPAAADTFFADIQTVLATPFQAISWTNRPAATHVAAFTGSEGAFNVTGITGAPYDRMLTDMQATVDPAERQAGLDELQAHLWEHGGDLVWGLAEQLDATLPGVEGVGYAQSLPRLDEISMP